MFVFFLCVCNFFCSFCSFTFCTVCYCRFFRFRYIPCWPGFCSFCPLLCCSLACSDFGFLLCFLFCPVVSFSLLFLLFLFCFPFSLVLDTFVTPSNLLAFSLLLVVSCVHTILFVYRFMENTWTPLNSPPFPPNFLLRPCATTPSLWSFPPHVCLFQICPARPPITLFALFLVCYVCVHPLS